LDHILNGCKRRLRINRIIVEEDGSETFEDEIVPIEIKPGTEEGTRFTLKQKGDRQPNRIPADIIFVVRDKPHNIFKRYGPHIEYPAPITRKQFLNGLKIDIPTLEEEIITFSLGDLSKPNTIKRFAGRGLPFADNPQKRGDLIVRFELDKNAGK